MDIKTFKLPKEHFNNIDWTGLEDDSFFFISYLDLVGGDDSLLDDFFYKYFCDCLIALAYEKDFIFEYKKVKDGVIFHAIKKSKSYISKDKDDILEIIKENQDITFPNIFKVANMQRSKLHKILRDLIYDDLIVSKPYINKGRGRPTTAYSVK